MIHVIVTYTIDPDFVEKNKQNIALFLTDFKRLYTSKFRYSVFTDSEGNVFTHLSEHADVTIQQELMNTPSFLRFQQERDVHILNDSHAFKELFPVGFSSI